MVCWYLSPRMSIRIYYEANNCTPFQRKIPQEGCWNLASRMHLVISCVSCWWDVTTKSITPSYTMPAKIYAAKYGYVPSPISSWPLHRPSGSLHGLISCSLTSTVSLQARIWWLYTCSIWCGVFGSFLRIHSGIVSLSSLSGYARPSIKAGRHRIGT